MTRRPNRPKPEKPPGGWPAGGGQADPNWVRRDAVPFEPGNANHMVHGANTERLVSAEAEAMIEVMQAELPWLERCDGMVLDILVRAIVRWRRIDARIAELDVEEVPDSLWQQVDREQRHILSSAKAMGMTAVDRAALMKDASWAKALQGRTVQDLGNRGAEIRERRRAELPAGEAQSQ